MKIKLLWLGKTKNKSIDKLIEEYESRLRNYCSVKTVQIKEHSQKYSSKDEQRKRESQQFVKAIDTSDYVVLLDEYGEQQRSVELAKWLQHKMNISIHNIVFIIAGAFGAHDDLKKRADFILSLSKMTLTHDMARVVLIEQLYRGFTILKREKYHNE